ncbi:MAG: class I SAM-dependent methyltransferase [Geminicoccaceae bacterium]
MLICHQDGIRDDVPAAFWLREAIDPLESRALDLCRGRVLDVGAGAGLHSLELQRHGLDVTAIDIASECVAIMRERGVRKAEVADLYVFDGGPFDTILCLCNGLDKVGQGNRLNAITRSL